MTSSIRFVLLATLTLALLAMPARADDVAREDATDAMQAAFRDLGARARLHERDQEDYAAGCRGGTAVTTERGIAGWIANAETPECRIRANRWLAEDDALRADARAAEVDPVFADARPAPAHFLDQRHHRGPERHDLGEALALQNAEAVVEEAFGRGIGVQDLPAGADR